MAMVYTDIVLTYRWISDGFCFWADFIHKIMNEEIWKYIAMGAIAILELVIIGIFKGYERRLNTRMDNQDEVLAKMSTKINDSNTATAVTLTDHTRRLIHLEDWNRGNHIVRYPEKNG